jgi:TIR domain/SIR2-like domain
MISTDDYLWENLIDALEEGRVVPIVGRDLLVVETDSGPQLFHNLVARRLAADLKVAVDTLPPGFDVNDVVYAYQDFHPSEVNDRVRRIVSNLAVATPEPLRLLAEVPSFSLFISTTVDTLLERTIKEVRRGKPLTSIAFPPSSSDLDFDEDKLKDGGSMVFQILGRVSSSAIFTVTEGQMLEQMHDFMGNRHPLVVEKLITRLQNSHLLVLGVSFPDWLARFLLRVCRAKPLWDSRPLMEIIADNACSHQQFSQFLHRFSPDKSHLITGGSPVEFVKELHRRWFERHPAPTPSRSLVPDAAGAGRNQPAGMEPGSIFISYTHEDRDAAFRLADTLGNEGLEVWVDRRLNPGDRYDDIIYSHIRNCCAFIALISSNTQERVEAYFHEEWDLACERQKRFARDAHFLFPVVIDGTPMASLNLRREMAECSAVQAPSGDPPAGLVQQLDQAQKNWRKRDRPV